MRCFAKALFETFQRLCGGWVVVVLLVAAAQAGAEDAGRVELYVGSIPDRTATSPYDRTVRAVFFDFVKTHPGIHVVSRRGLGQNMERGEQMFLMAQAGGTAPDLLMDMPNRKVKEFAEAGFLVPLNRFIERSPRARKLINDKVLPLISDDHGNIYAIPSGYFGTALYYRKDLFEASAAQLKAAGLSADRAPRTWEELRKYAEILTRAPTPERRPVYGVGFWAGFDAGYLFTNFVWQAGGDMVRHYKICPKCGKITETVKEVRIDKCRHCGASLVNVPYRWRPTFQERPGVEALEFLRDLKRARVGSPPQEVMLYAPAGQIYGLFRSGEIAMIFCDSSFSIVGQLGYDPTVTGVAPFPRGPSGKTANVITCNFLGINALVKDDPRRVEAAWQYIEHFLSPRAEQIRVDIFVREGHGRYLPPQLLQRYGYGEYVDQVERNWVEAQEKLMTTGRMIPACPGYQSLQTKILQEPLDSVLGARNDDVAGALDKAATNARVLFNDVDPGVRRRQRMVAYAIAGLVCVGLCFLLPLLVRQLRAVARGAAELGGSSSRQARRLVLIAWVLMLPALLSIALWAYVPLVRGSFIAFKDYRIMGGSRWVGFDNFITVVTDAQFWRSMRLTCYYVFLTLSLGFVTPIVTALMLHEAPKGRIIFRTIYYLPAVTTGVVTMLIWRQVVYDPSPFGVLNVFVARWLPWALAVLLGGGLLGTAVFAATRLKARESALRPVLAALLFGLLLAALLWRWGAAASAGQPLIGPQKWLLSPQLAMLCIVVPMVWAGAGPGCIIYLAALKGVPEEQYEAADLDGASVWHKIRYITLPTLKPLIIINFVGAVVGSFRAMQNVFVMTEGGPAGATQIIGIEIFQKAFVFLQFGYATAVGWILGFLLIGFTIYQLRILKNVRFTTTGRK